MTDTVLDRIKAYKLDEVAADKSAKPLEEGRGRGPSRRSGTALCRGAADGQPRRIRV